MIASDLHAAIIVAQDAQRSALRAEDRATMVHHLLRIGVVLQILDEAASRVKTMEQQPVPAHWRPQWPDHANLPPNVVPLHKQRGAYTQGGAA